MTSYLRCFRYFRFQSIATRIPVIGTHHLQQKHISPFNPVAFPDAGMDDAFNAKRLVTGSGSAASEAISNFANDLCFSLSMNTSKEKSFAISPVSILAVLGMILHTIKPEKKESFIRTIGLGGMTEEQAHEAISATLRSMVFPPDFPYGVIETAQALARKNGIFVADSCLSMLKTVYGADQIVSDALMKDINKWVADKTHGKIPKVLFNDLADLIFLNVTYLGLQWENKFEMPRHGWPVKNFMCANGQAAPVSMMKQRGRFSVYRGVHFDMLEMPYESPHGRRLSHLVFLSHDPAELRQMENSLDAAMIRKCRQEAQEEENVTLHMPKIKMESRFSLSDTLMGMGLPIKIEDFDSNLLQLEGGDIPNILHHVKVSTDEKGSEAAAATAAEIVSAAILSEPIPTLLNISHSYAYFIMDRDTPLFRGRVVDSEPLLMD